MPAPTASWSKADVLPKQEHATPVQPQSAEKTVEQAGGASVAGAGAATPTVTYSHDGLVATTSSLTPELLHALVVDKSILAIRVPEFASAALCKRLTAAILANEQDRARYTHDEGNREVYLGVDRIGVPFNSTYSGDDDDKRAYYAAVERTMAWAREACAPDVPPIARVVDELARVWPHGCRAGNFEGRDMLVGIARIMHAELSAGSETVHIDCLPPSIARLDDQLAANVYLQPPDDDGGELVAWDHRAYLQEENDGERGARLAETLRELQSDWLDAQRDGTEPRFRHVKLRPRAGDLFLLYTRRPHAVSRFAKGTRVSMQTFIGHNEGGPLLCWN